MTPIALAPSADWTELEDARRIVRTAQSALEDLHAMIGPELLIAARHIAACKGRVVFAGMGKSGFAAGKLAATFSSLGTPSLALHPADAAHGDLGKLVKGDILVCISNSGTTRQVLALMHYAAQHSILSLAMTAHDDSPMAQQADLLLPIPDVVESGPAGGVPMASTIVTITLGDALATLVANERKFSSSMLALLHPGGRIGQRLRPVRQLMHAGDRLPLVRPDTRIAALVEEISVKGFGIAGVVDPDTGKLLGVVTDGDLRRHFARLTAATAGELMHQPAITLPETATADEALEIARSHRISAIFMVNSQTGAPIGLVDLQDLLRVSVD